MSDEDLLRKVEAAADSAQRANGIARAALILAAMALAIGVLGLGLPLR